MTQLLSHRQLQIALQTHFANEHILVYDIQAFYKKSRIAPQEYMQDGCVQLHESRD